MKKKQYAVIGLGRFGTSIARRLHEAGQEVLGIDINETVLNLILVAKKSELNP